MKKEIESIIKIIENALNLKIKGGRGYSAGTPYDADRSKAVYGKSKYEEPQKVQQNEEEGPVQVSRAFRGGDDGQ